MQATRFSVPAMRLMAWLSKSFVFWVRTGAEQTAEFFRLRFYHPHLRGVWDGVAAPVIPFVAKSWLNQRFRTATNMHLWRICVNWVLPYSTYACVVNLGDIVLISVGNLPDLGATPTPLPPLFQVGLLPLWKRLTLFPQPVQKLTGQTYLFG